MIDPRYDVAVIGAGPAGLTSAAEMSASGLSVLVLESKPEIGNPVQCGEAVSRRCLSYSDMNDGPWIVHPIRSYRIHSPSGGYLTSSSDGCSIRRDFFDQELAGRAGESGAEIRTGTTVLSGRSIGDGWKLNTSNGSLGCRAVVLACGPVSHLNKKFGLSENVEFMLGLGAKIRRRDASEVMNFYTKGELEGGYGYYFPRETEVNIGLCARKSTGERLDLFMREQGIRRKEVISYHGGVIPDGGPLSKLTGRGVMAAGDCGGFCHPVSKGGIYCAMLSGREAGKGTVEYLSGDGEALERKEKLLREHPAFSRLNLKRRDLLASFNDRTLDEITEIVDGRDIKKLGRIEMAAKAALRPQLVNALKGGIGLVEKNLEWLDYTF
ncbi:MAG: geranylgeranyl reductase family protein [Thermoplasmatota archaeon]